MKKYLIICLLGLIILVGAKCKVTEEEETNTNENTNINANANVNENVNQAVEEPFFLGDWILHTSGYSDETGDYGEIWNVITINEGELNGNTYFGTADSKVAYVYAESDGKSIFVSQPVSSTAKYLVINGDYLFMFNENATFNGHFMAKDFATGALKNNKSGTITMFTAMKDDPEELMTWLEAAYEGSFVLDQVEDDALVDWAQE